MVQNGLWNDHLNSRAHQHKLLLSRPPQKRRKGDVENQQQALQETFATLPQIRSKHQDGSMSTKLPAFQALHEHLLDEHSSMYSSFPCILNLDGTEFYFSDLKKIVQQCLCAGTTHQDNLIRARMLRIIKRQSDGTMQCLQTLFSK